MKQLSLVFAAALLFPFYSIPAWAEDPAITIASAAKPSSFAQSTFGAAQDAAITTYIYAKLASHPDFSSSNLDISTNEGKVTLNGIVHSQQEANEIRQMVANTAGVESVDTSQVIISPEENSLYIKMSPAQAAETPIISETLAEQPLVVTEAPRVDANLAAVKKPDFEPRKQGIKHPLISKKQTSQHAVRHFAHSERIHKKKAKEFAARSRHLHLAKHAQKNHRLSQKRSGGGKISL